MHFRFLLQALLIAVSALVALSWMGLLRFNLTVEPHAIEPEQGFAFYTVTKEIPLIFRVADDRSSLGDSVLFESTIRMGSGPTLHDTIRRLGGGRHSLDQGVLRFSSSDGSDPRENGRQYVLQAHVVPGLGVYGLIGAIAGCLYFMSRRRKAVQGQEGSIRHYAGQVVTYSLSAAAWTTAIGFLWIVFVGWSPASWLETFLPLLALLLIGSTIPVVPLAIDKISAHQSWDLAIIHNVNRAKIELTGGLSSVILILLWCFLMFSAFDFNLEISNTVGPALWLSGKLILAPDSIQAAIYPQEKTWLPWLIALVDRRLGIPTEASHVALAVSSLVTGLLAIAWVGRLIGKTWWAGAIAVIVSLEAWLTRLDVGYAMEIDIPTFRLGVWGMSWALAVWALWLSLPATLATSLLVYSLTGVLLCMHPNLGVILGGVLLTGDALSFLFEPRRGAILSRALIGFVVLLVAASPQIFLLSKYQASQAALATDQDQAWWPLMALREPFHIFLWDDTVYREPVIWISLGWLTLFFTLALLAIAKEVPRSILLRLIATGLAVAIFCAIQFAATELWPTPLIASLILTRALFLVKVAALVIIAALPFLALRRWLYEPTQSAGFCTFCYGLAAILIALPDPSTTLKVTAAAALGLGTVATYFPGAIDRYRSDQRPLWPLSTAAAALIMPAVLVGLVANKITYSFSLMAAKPTQTWLQTTEFLRTSTAKDSLMLMPPYPYATVSARRTSLLDYEQFGLPYAYMHLTVSKESKLLRQIYGIDLTRYTPRSLAEFLESRGGRLCFLEHSYLSVISSESRIDSLKRDHPALAYVVGFKPGVTPMWWRCGRQESPLLRLPRAFENEEYVVYDVRTIQEPGGQVMAPASGAGGG
jgi:hypothetical protein